MSCFLDVSIADILAGYANGRWTPKDVARWCIASYESLETRYDAWESFSSEVLLKAAEESAARLESGQHVRPLEGIPVGVKDIFNTIDFPTQMGSPLWQGFSAGNDARAVFNLRRAGALVPGKTVTAEFAVHSLGKTKNPHSELLTPGTSSSGSAVAVATGMVPIALGTQTAGSIVRPASFCGVWGCKPSFGLVPRTGMLKTTDSLDSVGFFVSHASDLETVFDAVRVHGRNFPISHAALNDPVRQSLPQGRPWRIALVRPHVWSYVPGYAANALEEWCQELASRDPSRYEVLEVALPDGMARSHIVHETIYNRALAYYFQEEYRNAELISPVMKRLILAGQKISNEAYEAALEEQVQLAHQMDSLLSGFDALVTLSTAGEAPPRDKEELPDSALMWTLTHLAVVSAPVFRSPSGMPFGLQLVMRRYNDLLLFKFVKEIVSLGLLPAGALPRANRGLPEPDSRLRAAPR
jgi:Asp-tRNA(Asn)/Glu-tRNA(Gln) amidotransferase A subunit family amidase